MATSGVLWVAIRALKLTDSGFWVEGADQQKLIAEPQIDPVTKKKPSGIINVTKRPVWLSGVWQGKNIPF